MPPRKNAAKTKQHAKEMSPQTNRNVPVPISPEMTVEMTENTGPKKNIRTRAQARRKQPYSPTPDESLVPKSRVTKKQRGQTRRNNKKEANSDRSRSPSESSPPRSVSPSPGRSRGRLGRANRSPPAAPAANKTAPRGRTRKARVRAKSAKPSDLESDDPADLPMTPQPKTIQPKTPQPKTPQPIMSLSKTPLPMPLVKANINQPPNISTVIIDSTSEAHKSIVPHQKPSTFTTKLTTGSSSASAACASAPSTAPVANISKKQQDEFSSQVFMNAAAKVPIFSWFVDINNDSAQYQAAQNRIADWLKEVSNPNLILQLLSREEIAMPAKTPSKLRQKNLVLFSTTQAMDVDDSFPLVNKQSEDPIGKRSPECRQTRSATRAKLSEAAAASSAAAATSSHAAGDVLAATVSSVSQPMVRHSNRSNGLRTELSHPETNSDPSETGNSEAETEQLPSSASSLVKKTSISKPPNLGKTVVSVASDSAAAAPSLSNLDVVQTEPTQLVPSLEPKKPARKGARGAKKKTQSSAVPTSSDAAQPKSQATEIAATASSNPTAPPPSSVSHLNPLARPPQSPAPSHNLTQPSQKPAPAGPLPPRAVMFAPSPAGTQKNARPGAKRSISHGDLSRVGKSPGFAQQTTARLRAANSNSNLTQTPGGNKNTNAVQKQKQKDTANRIANVPDQNQSENVTEDSGLSVPLAPFTNSVAVTTASKRKQLKATEALDPVAASPSKSTIVSTVTNSPSKKADKKAPGTGRENLRKVQEEQLKKKREAIDAKMTRAAENRSKFLQDRVQQTRQRSQSRGRSRSRDRSDDSELEAYRSDASEHSSRAASSSRPDPSTASAVPAARDAQNRQLPAKTGANGNEQRNAPRPTKNPGASVAALIGNLLDIDGPVAKQPKLVPKASQSKLPPTPAMPLNPGLVAAASVAPPPQPQPQATGVIFASASTTTATAPLPTMKPSVASAAVAASSGTSIPVSSSAAAVLPVQLPATRLPALVNGAKQPTVVNDARVQQPPTLTLPPPLPAPPSNQASSGGLALQASRALDTVTSVSKTLPPVAINSTFTMPQPAYVTLTAAQPSLPPNQQQGTYQPIPLGAIVPSGQAPPPFKVPNMQYTGYAPHSKPVSNAPANLLPSNNPSLAPPPTNPALLRPEVSRPDANQHSSQPIYFAKRIPQNLFDQLLSKIPDRLTRMTPHLRTAPIDDYGVEDLNSGDDTDDDSAPRKEVPLWATGERLRRSIIEQAELLLCADAKGYNQLKQRRPKLFSKHHLRSVDLTKLLQLAEIKTPPHAGPETEKDRAKRLNRIKRRGSSAIWDTPPSFDASVSVLDENLLDTSSSYSTARRAILSDRAASPPLGHKK